MFSFAILIGIYSYLVFGLGLLGFLYKENIIILTLLYFLVLIFFIRKWFRDLFKCFKTFKQYYRRKITEKLILIILAILSEQIIVNLIGVLGPEFSFDALWYHLTLPRIYLSNHQISYIPGGLLYYSTMPELTEMLYVVALTFSNEILAKFIHFSFGILSSIALYKFSRKFFPPKISLIAVLIFYSNLVVGWESIISYIDLTRTFFEIMALWGFINWVEKRERKWLVESAVMTGFAIATKLLAFGSLFIFDALIIYVGLIKKKTSKFVFTNLLVYWCISLLVVMPWFVFSFIHTKNPVYPLFTNLYRTDFNWSLINPLRFLTDVWNLFLYLADPISPIYIMFLPLVVLFFKRLKPEIKLIAFYSFLAIITWYLTPRTGGGRFILPYLPAFSIVIGSILNNMEKTNRLKNISILLIIIISLISIAYRGIANNKYLPVILGRQTQKEFLSKHLNFSFGDFYDTDSYFEKNIKQTDKVLLYGFHNLYYVNFPFVDSSFVKKGDNFNYIAVQNAELPERFKFWNLIYVNSKTNVKLYSAGGQMWVY